MHCYFYRTFVDSMWRLFAVIYFFCQLQCTIGQNTIVGDGFGGRLWYKPLNYSIGSYIGLTICGADSQLYTWGDNINGMLGNGTQVNSAVPVKTSNMNHVKFATAGYLGAAIQSNNSGWVWGVPYDHYIQGKKYNLTPIKLLDSAYFADAAQNGISFVKTDGTVWSYGLDQFGQFGNGERDWIGGPLKFVQMKNMYNARRIAQSEYATAVLTSNGEIYMSGENNYGNLGFTGNYNVTVPTKNPNLKNIVDIKSVNMAFCALDKNGFVYTWGKRGEGYIGDGDTVNSDQKTPLKNPYLKNIIAISGCNDGWHFLALDSAKNVWSWGMNLKGSCGTGSWRKTHIPQLVATDAIDILAGESFSMIIKSDGSLWAAGGGGYTSIWLNLSDSSRNVFTKLNPQAAPFNLCPPLINSNGLKVKTIGKCEQSFYTFKGIPVEPNYAYQFKINNQIYTGDSVKVWIPQPGTQNGVFYRKQISTGKTDSFVFAFGVNKKPKINIQINDSLQCLHNNNFIFTYQNPGINVTQSKWDLQDTIEQQTNPASYTYKSIGIKKIKLVLRSDSSCVDSGNLQCRVYPNPTAKFTVSYYNNNLSSVSFYNQSSPNKLSLFYHFGIYGSAKKDTTLKSSKFSNFYTTLTVTDSQGCTDTVGQWINFSYPVNVFFPTAFTPGNNALNPGFGPVFTGELHHYKLRIYNRWGAKIFESNQTTEIWDGKYMHQICSEGVYVYIATFSDIQSREYNFTGTLHLLRDKE